MDTTKLFANGDSNEFDAKVVGSMEKNRIQDEEIKNLKLEQESEAILNYMRWSNKKRKQWKTKPWLKMTKEFWLVDWKIDHQR